jgi:putative endonuclease
MNHNQTLGKWGESTAAQYLQEHGYQIIETNARTPYGEIDLVARLQDQTIFVEVKTRSNRRFGLPEEALTPRKLKHMHAAAQHYASQHNLDFWQCDAIAIETQPQTNIEHFQNVTSHLT